MLSKEDKENLFQAVKEENPKKLAKVTAQILAKDDKALQEIVEAYLAEDERIQLKEQIQALEWFISTLSDVFDYNEFSIIPLDLIQKWLGLVVVKSQDIFTKEMYQKIHLEILESGLVTLPTSNKAIQLYGEEDV